MIFGKTKLEFKVGLFVFIGVVILSTFVLLIGKFETWTAGYRVNFIFNFVNGVKLGAPVRFAGVDVGEVKDLKFFFDSIDAKTKVNIVCWIKKQVKIPMDSLVWVNTLGLLGEKYIEVMPGKDYANILPANQSLRGDDPVPMQEVTKLAKDIVLRIDEATAKIMRHEGTLGKLIFQDNIYNELEAFASDIRQHPWKLFYRPKED
ncbi:MAG: hypothetical protein A3G38_02610 [Omnitrophica WOR_2 bacterium RIFCSPLOWO2_12_FULL_51_8]|nr:MAG: hypothetical protein A3G38_02610 [Omnitrophica WOR_2 bacterium RIFCSPLOWO2_12_FULL_51_8]